MRAKPRSPMLKRWEVISKPQTFVVLTVRVSRMDSKISPVAAAPDSPESSAKTVSQMTKIIMIVICLFEK